MRIKRLTVDVAEYKLTPGLKVLMSKQPQPNQWNSDDYQAYKFLCVQTKVRLFPNPAVAVRPHVTWKYTQLLKKIVLLGERLEEESEDSDDTDTASIGDISESSDIPSPDMLSPGHGILPSPAHTRSYGKAKRRRIENLFVKVTKGME